MNRARTCLLPLLATCLLLAGGCGKKGALVYEDRFEQAIGQFFGEQVAAAAPGGGKVVVLLRKGTGELDDKKNAAYLAGLTEGFGDVSYDIQQAGPDLTNTKPQHQATVVQALTRGWPARAFLGWCAVDRNAVAVVSFIEFPDSIRASVFKKLPPVFIFSTTGRDTLRTLAAQGTVQALVLPKAGADLEAKPPRKASAREVVECRYDVVTP